MLFEKEGALGLSLEPVTKPREPGVKLKAVKDGSPAVVLDRPSCCTTLEPGALLVALQEGGKAGDDMSVWELLRTSSLRKQVLVGIVIKIGVQVRARNSGAQFGRAQNFPRAIL